MPRHRHLRLDGIVICALALAMVAAGCSSSKQSGSSGTTASSSSAPGTATASAGQPQSGGTFTYEVPSEVRSMDPTIAGGSALSGEPPRLLAVYDGLVIVDTATDKVTMGTADSLTSTDNIVWTLKLKPNIKFSDGTVYDANAVKFNWQRQATIATAPSYGLMKTVKSMDIVDPLTMTITLTGPNGVFPRNVSAGSINYIASPAAVTAKGQDFGSSPVGAGPFIMKDWVRDSQMTLTRNPTYWNAPKPYIDTLVIKVILDDTQRYNSVSNGEGDSTLMSTLPLQKQAKDAGLAVVTIPGIGAQGISFNMTKAPFDDVRIRQAFYESIDPVQLNQVANNGLGTVATGWFPQGSDFYDASLTFPKYDPVAAQKLFDAYFADKGDAQLNVEMTNTGSNPQINDYLTGVFAKINHAKYKATLVAQAQLTTDIRAHNFVSISYAYLGVDPEPNMVESFLSTGTRNFWGLKDPTLDAALLQARNSTDLATRKTAYAAAQKALLADLPMYLLPLTHSATISNKKVQNMQFFEDGGPRFDLVWIKK
jgi:peptide/nickel transport system substrate-binding protein